MPDNGVLPVWRPAFTLIELLVVWANRLRFAPSDFSATRKRFTLIELLVVVAKVKGVALRVTHRDVGR
jgi:competence protein ComGC